MTPESFAELLERTVAAIHAAVPWLVLCVTVFVAVGLYATRGMR